MRAGDLDPAPEGLQRTVVDMLPVAVLGGIVVRAEDRLVHEGRGPSV